MPWRRTKDPYAIWVSEIMLQQTQVSVVIPYWERWMARFPSIGTLAQASEQDVLELWQGLGYYRRAKMLLAGAKAVVDQGLPATAEEWLRVPGVGEYTAGAIASIALGEAAPLVDGNVARVYSRLNADPAETTELMKSAWAWAERSMHPTEPGDWNQSLMELGATICTPVEPKCDHCPVRSLCSAGKAGTAAQYPTPKEAPELTQIQTTLWIVGNETSIAMRIPTDGEWWSGMHCLPMQTEAPCDGWVQDLGKFKFAVTNHRISAEVKRILIDEPVDGFTMVDRASLGRRPIPAPHRRALKLDQSI